jgi:LysM repeat protein
VTEDQLKVLNKLPNDIIKPCQKLVVAAPSVTVTPKSAETPKEYRVIAKPKTPTPAKTTVTAKGVTKTSAALVKEGSGLHVVQKGETIIGLAKQFLMTEAEFRKINFMTVDESLSIGQVVRTKDCACTIAKEEDNTLSLQPVPVTNDVPKGYNYVGSKSATAKGTTTRKYHVVQATETLYAIAKKYGKSVDELRKLNSFSGSEVIVPNQTIVLE